MNKWVMIPAAEPTARIRLFCFPYAGGGASIFRSWATRLPGVEIVGIQLPGRENRLSERPISTMDTLLDGLSESLMPLLHERPFAFFGHSMGARIAFALMQRLEEQNGPQPTRFFVSGSPAPCLGVPETAWAEPDDRLLTWLASLGGTPPEVLAHPDLMRLALPTIRADLTAGATWHRHLGRTTVPIHAFAGTDDDYATPERARAWAQETTGSCEVSVIPGGHFFVKEQESILLPLIERDLNRVAA